MGSGGGLERLFECASEYGFDDFTERFEEQARSLTPEELAEARLMRAQIKLFASDETLLEDLNDADGFDGVLRFPCLNDRWACDSSNRFVVFNEAPGALPRFLRILPQAEEKLKRRYGESGAAMARQVASEILYFSGRFDDALRLAEQAADRGRGHGGDIVLSLYVQFRCNLSMGRQERAEQCMLEMIRMAKTRPECLAAYLVVRDWANVTTGWSGDSPRFCDAPDGGSRPILEDRLEVIRNGISRLSPHEEPFVQYAERAYPGACTMRRHFMDIFHAIYWFQAGDIRQAEEYFERACRMSVASGLVMPFAEYGRQIVPLLRYVEANCAGCPSDWIASVLPLAERYEDCLRAYRAEAG